jgi:diacylglycerol O-acyltransferase-1
MRLSFILRRVIELIFVGIVLLFMADQYVKPTLVNSIKSFDSLDVLAIFERVLKLAVPNLVMWLLIFYGIFHSYLNLVAEIMGFEDRCFYRSWWNSTDMGQYWRLWNRPVHDWLAKHVYCVAVRRGIPSTVAKLIVFFISALLHEVLVSLPCKMIGVYAFIGMMLQLPSIVISQKLYKKLANPVIGNVMFWCTLPLLGQPLLIMLYWYQYYCTFGIGA